VTWEITAEPSRFDEAIAWFETRWPVTEQAAVELEDYAGQRAWKIAGVTQLDVVQTVHESLVRALESGVPFEEWQDGIEDVLAAAWGTPDSPHVETVFRNATMSANAGRWQQMNEPAIRGLRPFLYFDGIADSRQSTICQAWNGTIRPIDDPVWQHASPQLHHRCRSQLRSLTEREAMRRGLTPVIPEETATPGFGRPPTESDWQPERGNYQAELFAEYEAKRSEIQAQVERPKL